MLGRSLPVIRIDGPFGAPAQDVLSNEVAVLIGAGIGVTPFASILKDIWYKQQSHKLGALRRVLFVWINREAENFEWFNALLKNLEKVSSSLLI
jgi:NADPH oxidase